MVRNVAIIAAGVGVLSTGHVAAAVPIVIFVVGGASAIMSMHATATQHDYYQNVRDRKTELEKRLGLDEPP